MRQLIIALKLHPWRRFKIIVKIKIKINRGGPGSELFTCLSAPPPGGGLGRGVTVPPPAALGSNEPITGAAKNSVGCLVHSAQTVVRLVRERSAYPPGLRNVDYGCFDGQRKLDHTTERLQGPNLTKMGTSPRPHHVPTLRPHGPIS